MDEVVREMANGILCLIALFVCGMTGWHVISNFQLRYEVGTRAAISICVCMGGIGLFALWLWVLAFHQARGWDDRWLTQTPALTYVFIATVTASVGALCKVRVFSPDERSWLWIAVGVVCISIPIILHFSI